MATIQESINRTIQMSESAIKIAQWQENLLNNMGLRSAVEGLSVMSNVLINSNLRAVLNDFQKQLNHTIYSMIPIQSTLDIISKQIKFTDISGLININKINIDFQNIFNQIDLSSLVLNCYKTPYLNIGDIGLLELEYDDDENFEYNDLKEDEKEEVKSILYRTLDLISKGEIALDKTWGEWYANLVIRHPLTAKIIAKLASTTFEMIITRVLMVVIMFGSSFGNIAVKEEPIANAPIITNVYVTNINIVQEENINYYYKVIYVDTEGKEQTGYVSKRKYTEVVKNLNEIAEE